MGGKGSKVIIIVVLLSAAGIISYFTSRPEAPPKTAEGPQKVDLICEACGEHFQDTQEHLAQVEIKGSVRAANEGAGRVRRMAKERSLYPCPKCHESTAVIAGYCKEHDKYFPLETAEGGRGNCPLCP